MNWSIESNRPPLAGTGAVIRVDGEEVRRVRGFSTEGGWVRAVCLENCTGWEGRPHALEADDRYLCEKFLRGEVTVDWPDGPPRWLEPIVREMGWEPPE